MQDIQIYVFYDHSAFHCHSLHFDGPRLPLKDNNLLHLTRTSRHRNVTKFENAQNCSEAISKLENVVTFQNQCYDAVVEISSLYKSKESPERPLTIVCQNYFEPLPGDHNISKCEKQCNYSNTIGFKWNWVKNIPKSIFAVSQKYVIAATCNITVPKITKQCLDSDRCSFLKSVKTVVSSGKWVFTSEVSKSGYQGSNYSYCMPWWHLFFLVWLISEQYSALYVEKYCRILQ